MANKIFPDAKKLPVRNAANVRSDSKKRLRASIVFVLLISFATALVFGLGTLHRVLFTSNPRFRLRKIIVQSEGYWQKRSAQLASRLGVHIGDNLFSLDPGALCRQLSAITNVQHCEVTRILPDTLKIRAEQRGDRSSIFDLSFCGNVIIR